MKKILLLFLSVAVAISAAASVNVKEQQVLQTKSLGVPLVDKNVKNAAKWERPAMDEFSKRQPLKKAVTATRAAEQPEGELVTYTRSGNAVYNHGGTYIGVEQSGEMDIVYDPDGTTVYLKNIIFKSDSLFGDYWVQGTLNADGTAISVPMGQRIYNFGTNNAYIKLAWGTSTYRVHNGEQFFNFNVADSVGRAVYLIEGNTITLQNSYTEQSGNPQFRGTGLGCVLSSSNESFGGFMEWNTVLTNSSLTPLVITDIPESCTVHTYKRNSAYLARSSFNGFGTNNGYFKVAFDNDNQPDVYIQNPILHYKEYNTWVKGSYNRMTKTITIPTGQYIYWFDDYQYGLVLGWGSTTAYIEVDENGVEQEHVDFSLDSTITEIKMKLDGDYIYLLGTEGDIIHNDYPEYLNATGMATYWNDDLTMSSVEFCNRDEDGVALPWGQRVNMNPAVPANPTADEWYDCGDESGYSKFSFTLPTTDINGNVIIQDLMSYSIYLDDDQLFTFDVDTYNYNLTEDVTEVTYDIWRVGYDFHSTHCYFYRTNINDQFEPLFNWRIGIQVHYSIDGVTNSSDIVYLEVFPNPNVLLGDVNGDNSVNISDVTTLIDYLLSPDSTEISLTNADVNQDQSINISDVTALIDLLLGGS